MLPHGQQVMTILNTTQFSFVMSAIPSAPGATKTGADLTSGTNYTGTAGALIQWGDILCDPAAPDVDCPPSYSEFYYGTKQQE